MVWAVLAAPGHISIIPFVFATLFSTSPVCSPSFVYCKSVDSEPFSNDEIAHTPLQTFVLAPVV